MSNASPDTMIDLLALAAADSVRWWLTVDGPILTMIDDDTSDDGGNGLLTAQSVETISKLYGFRRTMLATPAHDRLVADTFSSHVRQGATLLEQAMGLRDMVEALSARAVGPLEKRRVRNLASGASKLAWFVEPKGWTPFDSIAAMGLGLPQGDALVRMVRFYAALDMIQFTAMASLVSLQIDRSGIECWVSNRNRVRGERVIDRFLMFRGMKPERRESETALSRAFVRCLPELTRSRLNDLMEAIKGDVALTYLVSDIDRRIGEQRYRRAA